MCLLNGPPQEFNSGILLRINRSKLAEEKDVHCSCLAAGGMGLNLYGKNNYNRVILYFSVYIKLFTGQGR